MKNAPRFFKVLITCFLGGFLSACTTLPVQTQTQPSVPPYPPPEQVSVNVNPKCRLYSFNINNQTEYNIQKLNKSDDAVYNKGYDYIKRGEHPDFDVTVTVKSEFKDDPQKRAANANAGAAMGVASVIVNGGGSLLDVMNAAADGSAAGADIPVGDVYLVINLDCYDYKDRVHSGGDAYLKITNMDQSQLESLVDNKVASFLQDLPTKEKPKKSGKKRKSKQ